MDRTPVIPSEDILKQFSDAADRYNHAARLQEGMAWRLAGHCRHLRIPRGFWADLGRGTGRPAAASEIPHPGQSVLRVAGRAAMPQQHTPRAPPLHAGHRRSLPPRHNTPHFLRATRAPP